MKEAVPSISSVSAIGFKTTVPFECVNLFVPKSALPLKVVVPEDAVRVPPSPFIKSSSNFIPADTERFALFVNANSDSAVLVTVFAESSIPPPATETKVTFRARLIEDIFTAEVLVVFILLKVGELIVKAIDFVSVISPEKSIPAVSALLVFKET